MTLGNFEGPGRQNGTTLSCWERFRVLENAFVVQWKCENGFLAAVTARFSSFWGLQKSMIFSVLQVLTLGAFLMVELLRCFVISGSCEVSIFVPFGTNGCKKSEC